MNGNLGKKLIEDVSTNNALNILEDKKIIVLNFYLVMEIQD